MNLCVIVAFYSWHIKTQANPTVKSERLNRNEGLVLSKLSLKIDWVNYTFVTEELKRAGPGEHGEPVILVDETDKQRANESIFEYSFNAVASEKISLDRSIPDTRIPNCKGRKYYADLPPVSVIIVSHNEHPSVLLRTVHSVINRTPTKLLKEIILVDDSSTKVNLLQALDNHISSHRLKNVRIVRLKERHGLMKARIAGVHAAKTDIVVVMDGHIEVNVNWLPPLIEPIIEDYRTVTEPMVNFIDWNTIRYSDFVHSGHRGIFNWGLGYTMAKRLLKHDEDLADNFEQPTLLGAIVAFDRNFFFELGEFDDGLQIWGGEQFDLSFKCWRCGGRILGVPCSTVGHNYKGGGHHPYAYNTSYIFGNLARIAETWFDQYKEQFYIASNLEDDFVRPNVSKQLEWKKNRGCHSFDWYINKLFPEIFERYPINFTGYASGAVSIIIIIIQCAADVPAMYTCSTQYYSIILCYFLYYHSKTTTYSPFLDSKCGFTQILC